MNKEKEDERPGQAGTIRRIYIGHLRSLCITHGFSNKYMRNEM